MAAAAAAAAGRAGAAAAGRAAAAVIVVGGGVVLAKWGREGVSPGESRRVSLPLSAKLLETREPASCCRMGRPPAGPHPPNSLPAGPAEALPPTALPGGAELDSSLRLPLRARPGRQGGRPGGGRGPQSSLPSRQRAARPGQSCGERLSSFYSSPKP